MTRSLPPLAALARMLELRAAPLPLLVVRLPELERVAWRRGLRPARRIERRAGAAFARAAGVVLRSDDVLAHDAGSDVFVAALAGQTRGGTGVAVDARSALARIAAALNTATGLSALTGWTTVAPGDAAGSIDAIVERALARGAQERERYAFFSVIGHELRTPLSSIRGYLETVIGDGVDAPTSRRFLRIAHDESLRMSRLIEGMFEISLLDLSAAAPTRAVGGVADALRSAVDACAAAAARRRIGIETGDAGGAQVAIDADRLTLVLVNLIGNAVKHGRSGGAVFVGIDAADRDFVRITVDDDGPGIAPGERERVFAFGERGATVAEGSGIGLALVRLIVERAGGRVFAERSPLGGARFVLTVPRA